MNLCRDYETTGHRKKDRLRILIFADSGAGQSKKYGTGQYEVGRAMAELCTDGEDPCDFALVSGDLIYPDGVEHVFDGQFRDKFENVYDPFGRFDFFLVPGNHDHHGNVIADVEYTFWSERWRMFDRQFGINDLPDWISIFGFDTPALIAEDDVDDTTVTQRAAYQTYMCERDKAKWRIIFGHHPTVSLGDHGGEDTVARKLTEFYQDCQFDVYITAHNHIQEHIHANLFDVVVQGGGGGNLSTVEERPFKQLSGDAELGRESYVQRYARADYGFAIVDVTESEMNIYFYATKTWEPKGDAFTRAVRAEDYIYHCKWTQGSSEGCIPQAADNDKWLQDN